MIGETWDDGRLKSIRWTGDEMGLLIWVCDRCGARTCGDESQEYMVRTANLHRCPPERVTKDELTARLKAFGREMVAHGDMTPAAQMMLDRILGGTDNER